MERKESIKLLGELQQNAATLQGRLFFAFNMYKLKNNSAPVEGEILKDLEDMAKARRYIEEAEILLGNVVTRNNVQVLKAKEAGAI